MVPEHAARRAAALAAGAVVLCAPSAAGAAPARPDGSDLPRLTARLADVTEQAERLAEQLEQARAHDGGLRRSVEDVAEQQDAARQRLGAVVRQAYITGRARSPEAPLARAWNALTPGGAARTASRASAAAAREAQEALTALESSALAARDLQARSEQFRASLRDQAAQALAAQDAARTLLAAASELAAQVIADAPRRSASPGGLAPAPARAVPLTEVRAALDEVSASVTESLTPARTERGRRAGRRQAPTLALVEAAGSGYPRGFGPSGRVVRGTATWYGPGFVGRPTASGTPYDPERLTCAHKTLPFGTVLHVSAHGRSTNCLVNDRGPYVGDRVLDLSRAGARALSYTGTAEVVAEVLEPLPPR